MCRKMQLRQCLLFPAGGTIYYNCKQTYKKEAGMGESLRWIQQIQGSWPWESAEFCQGCENLRSGPGRGFPYHCEWF